MERRTSFLSLVGLSSLWLGLFHPVQGAFSIYSGLDKSLVQIAYGVSDQCFEALNTTIHCDKYLGSKATSGPDNYYWHEENVTALCTQDCATSLSSWLAAVDDKCDGEIVPSSGVPMLAKAIPTLWMQAYDLVCMQDSASNWCFLESQDWQGSDYIRWSPYTCYNANEAEIPPECDDLDFSTAQITPDMKDVTVLYDKSLLCSECFIRMWRQRLMSSLLPSGEHTDYLLEQYESMQKYCSTNLPVTTYATNLLVSSTTTSQPVSTSTSLPSTDSCFGQIVKPDDTYMGCIGISDQFNVSTGDVIRATNSETCDFDSPICLPLPCEIDIVYDNPTCEQLAASYSTEEVPVTLTQLLTWNPNILGSCGFLNHVQRVCKRPPGGFFNATGVVSSPTTAGSYYTTATASEPTQVGTVLDCGRYYRIVSGDTCNSVALRFGLTFSELKSLNTYLWDNCTNLWYDYDACVAPVSQPPVSEDGTCGPSNGNSVCDGTSFGRCCSTSGFCGSTDEYCGSGNCVSGDCQPSNSATTNGTCGPDWGYTTCTNPSFGPCCSIYGNCGSSADYCGAGNCYSGKCDEDNGGKSINGECGPGFAGNKTCTGTQFGDCCSVSGYCGSTDDYCKAGNCYSGACIA